MQKQYSQNVTTQQFSEVSAEYTHECCRCLVVVQVRLFLNLNQFEEFNLPNLQNLPLPLGQPGCLADEGAPLTAVDEH